MRAHMHTGTHTGTHTVDAQLPKGHGVLPLFPALGAGSKASVCGRDALRHHQHVSHAACEAVVVPMDDWGSLHCGRGGGGHRDVFTAALAGVSGTADTTGLSSLVGAARRKPNCRRPAFAASV